MIEKWNDDQVYTNINYSAQKLIQTEFDKCKFENCDFSDADLSESDFVSCRFENCNFSNARLSGTGMKDVHFIECKLIGMSFAACSDFLFSVNFQKCVLDYAVFAEKKMKKTKFVDCSLKEVDFSGTDLSLSDFHHCDLLQTVFHRTNLEKADFRTAKNYSMDPEANRIKKAKFSYTGIIGLLGKYKIELE
ncbi:MAG TPA: pentapeptide repeat-containing protein [Prolixibacteraceae bacterium]|nr:pentapeptide repeat-containing protein [Prolixibacteraceae bacterium]